MASLESPLNTAHQHAANADDFIAQGLLIPASEEHTKAAEAFLACIDATHDENTKRTLRMLFNDHVKASKELQRRIGKLQEENKDPSLPQRSNVNAASAAVSSVALPAAPSPPPQARQRMSDSQQMVDESFMLLGNKSDSGDPFNQFWKITEGMLDYLSQPVAFATAPLVPPDITAHQRRGDPSSSSDTDLDDPISRGLSRGISLVKAAKSRVLARHDSSATASDSDGGRYPGPSTFPPKPRRIVADWDDDGDDDDDMADSFCVIPSKSDTSASVVLKKENTSLKAELEQTKKQLSSVEGILKMRQEQDQQLRDSIIVARKEAHRAMLSSTLVTRPGQPVQPNVDLASLNLNVNVPPVPQPLSLGRDREAQLLRRVRELEEEVRVVRAENEKQKAMIVRFRERWEKLKESAKRKKEAKAANAEGTFGVGDRIDEEPEAEAEAEKDDLRPRRHGESSDGVPT